VTGFLSRLTQFADIVYEPKQHLFFALIWYLSLSGLFVSISHSSSPWKWGLPSLITGLTFFIILFVLRAIDEVKDFEYDQRHNPDRPLVCGAVSRKDIALYVILGALLVVVLNLVISPYLALFVVINIGYGLLLIKLEQWLPLMGRSRFFNLLITYPVSIALSFYALLQMAVCQGIAIESSHFMLIGCYVMAFLHFEIVRKSMWRNLCEPSELLYSNEIGTKNALLVSTIAALLACVGVVWLTAPWQLTGIASVTGWLPLINLLFVVLSLKLFYQNRNQSFNPRKFSVPFIVGFYSMNLVHALTQNQLQLAI
jgi:4-hydroxybenzoate polyprenyltransferase